MGAESAPAESAGAWAGPYLRARQLEGRLYPDSIVAGLPDIPANHPLAAEWRLRADSATRLTKYLARLPAPIRVIEVGSGNGWLSNQIARVPGAEVAGLEGNVPELEQARRVFGAVPNLHFVLGDATTAECPFADPSVIVLASVIQYVPDLPSLIERLLGWLRPGGELHILDSPLYSPANVATAEARSRDYYQRLGVPEMAALYHHHTRQELDRFSPEILYRPDALGDRLNARLFGRPRSPFPWLRIRP
jgi:SAM-dependent methyltransferase